MVVEILTPPYELLKAPQEPPAGAFVRADIHYNPAHPGKMWPGGRVFVRVQDDLGDGWVPAYAVVPRGGGESHRPRTWSALCAEALSAGGSVDVIESEPARIPAPCCGQLLTDVQVRQLAIAVNAPRGPMS